MNASPESARARSGPAGGRLPMLVVVAAALAGIALARVIDWRSHAHPR